MTVRNFVSLAAVTADATGSTLVLPEPKSVHGMQVVLTGAPASGTVTLYGTINGANFFSLGAVFTIGSDTSGDIKFATGKPVIGIRAVLASLSGGTSPTVTAVLTSSD